MKAERRRRARRRHSLRASTCEPWCTSTEAAPIASTGTRSSARTSTTSVSTASTRTAARADHAGRRGSEPSLRRRARDAGRPPLDRRPRAARPRASARATSSTSSSRCRRTARASRESIAGGRDFYSNPRISPDGARLCFLAWNFPWMPWDGCELFVAELRRTERSTTSRTSQGATARSPSGSRSGARMAISCSRATAAAGGTSSECATVSGACCTRPRPSSAIRHGSSARGRSRSSRTAGCSSRTSRGGRTYFGLLDPENGDARRPRPPVRRLVAGRSVAAEGSTVVFVAGSATVPNEIVRSTSPAGRQRRCGRAPRCRWTLVLLGAACDRVPDRGRSHSSRALLPAGEPGAHGAGGRARLR